jgi:hypothetical protein
VAVVAASAAASVVAASAHGVAVEELAGWVIASVVVGVYYACCPGVPVAGTAGAYCSAAGLVGRLAAYWDVVEVEASAAVAGQSIETLAVAGVGYAEAFGRRLGDTCWVVASLVAACIGIRSWEG